MDNASRPPTQPPAPTTTGASPGTRPGTPTAAPALDLTASPVALTRALVDIPSESHHEAAIAD
ncbi:succinyl-diaminopimelate desuccinylase, partial [Corynebacterium bovis]